MDAGLKKKIPGMGSEPFQEYSNSYEALPHGSRQEVVFLCGTHLFSDCFACQPYKLRRI